MKSYNIALAGNPNVGKSTVFNSFTGLHQHTGNWPGKTVENTQGEYIYNNVKYIMQDLPGTYSLTPNSAEEKVTCDYIKAGKYDALVIVLDTSCIERNLDFAVQVLKASGCKVIICLNLIDEAKKKGIEVDEKKLSVMTGVPVLKTAARSGEGMQELKAAIEGAVNEKTTKCINCKIHHFDDDYAKTLFKECCNFTKENADSFDRKIDKYLISKSTGIPIMLFLLGVVFWLTIIGANYPSMWLSSGFSYLGEKFRILLQSMKCPKPLASALTDGIYTTLTWIISVMLPPMAIFFPLFTLIEDSGYLPRIAFNLDSLFKKANAHGKQSLTMAMGFGCNACGVTGCRIIDSPRERLIAIITNSLVPCNGRFPALIAVISMFMIDESVGLTSTVKEAAILLIIITLSVVVTLIMSKLLSVTFLRGVPSSFVLELPPYRRPQIGKVIVRSIFDRTIFVLFRAIVAAAPAGLFIWLLANCKISDKTVLSICTEFFDPIGTFIGLDGAILLAFLLGFPANEIVLPIVFMIYISGTSLHELPALPVLREILVANGWTIKTAVCTIIFMLFHFPCSTSCITIYKETKSIKYTLLSFFLPLAVGSVLCILVNLISSFMEICI